MTLLAAVGRLLARLRGNRQSGLRALQGRANVAVMFPDAHSDILLSAPCPHLPHYTKKHLSKGATPACQSHGLKPPDQWCRWMVMDNQQAWGERAEENRESRDSDERGRVSL